jgi:hypothetical protein
MCPHPAHLIAPHIHAASSATRRNGAATGADDVSVCFVSRRIAIIILSTVGDNLDRAMSGAPACWIIHENIHFLGRPVL